ncbi:MAG: galactosyltransferase [Methanolobus sp. T82-4]|nr:MAG: galactosyltransferase [Methanolobus sp. T82-4]
MSKENLYKFQFIFIDVTLPYLERRIHLTEFYFAISLKPKVNSVNWEIVLSNLENTLKSIDNSSNNSYHILIATRDPDDLSLLVDSSKTTLVIPDFDPPTSIHDRDVDKIKTRRLIGSHLKKIAKKPFYVMFLDADDLVHKELVDFVLSDDNCRGYTIFEGYVLDAANGELRRKDEFNTICGSCYVGYFHPEEMPESPYDMECYFSEHRGHRKHVEIATQKGRQPDLVPFPSVIYIKGHDESLESIKRKSRLEKSKTLRLVLLLSTVDTKLYVLLNRLRPIKFNEECEVANKMLQEKFGQSTSPNLNVIILGKRRFRFLRSRIKKYYDHLYKKVQYSKSN